MAFCLSHAEKAINRKINLPRVGLAQAHSNWGEHSLINVTSIHTIVHSEGTIK